MVKQVSFFYYPKRLSKESERLIRAASEKELPVRVPGEALHRVVVGEHVRLLRTVSQAVHAHATIVAGASDELP